MCSGHVVCKERVGINWLEGQNSYDLIEIDNKGAVDLANNWSIGGRTKVIWVAGCDNDADIFTKNLDGPLFERFAQVFVGVDEYTPENLIPE